MELLARRVTEARLANNLSQRELSLATKKLDKKGVSHGYIQLIEKAAVPNPGTAKLGLVANALGYLTVDELLGATEPLPHPSAPGKLAEVVAIPIVGRASAGATYMGEVHISSEEAAGRPLKAIRVDGECLVPDVEPGDTAIIDVAAIPQEGEIVVVLDAGTGDTLAKWFHRTPEGVAELHRNDGPPVQLSGGPLQLQGVVVRITRQPGRRRAF